ncbi:MAG: Fic family protein [Actinomycetes bacterium]
MARWERAHWESSVAAGVPRRDRRSGTYHRYLPDHLDGRPLAIDPPLSRRLAVAERAVRALSGLGAESLAGVARFLLRSEAIASSRIEGVAPSPQQVALAELGTQESVRGVSEQARLVANNMTVVRQATSDLVAVDEVTVAHVVDLHAALLPEDARRHGLRTVQNWIGGSTWHPLDADFVPPPHEQVPELMNDLVAYLNGAVHSPIVHAALVHAQFETIHPFTDGNGRVGRALIHTVLTRRGLTPAAVLPVSLVLATLREAYVEGLARYRYHGEASSVSATSGVRSWLATFTETAMIAAQQSADLVTRVLALEEDWRQRLATHRSARGVREMPRAGSASARLLAVLPEAPVVTARSAQRILGVSFPAAASALDELHAASVLDTRTVDRGATAYVATEVLDLITTTERRLASTAFDTRVAAPRRAVPTPPHQEQSPE